MIEQAAFATLIFLNLWQFWFWGRHTSRLIDKLMSRNYAEYKQVEQSGSSPGEPRTQHADQVKDDDVLKELNGMLGGM